MKSVGSIPMCFVPKPTKQTIVVHESVQIVFDSDVEKNKLFDTTVKIFPAYKRECLCVIAGSDIKNFTSDFIKLINKYKI